MPIQRRQANTLRASALLRLGTPARAAGERRCFIRPFLYGFFPARPRRAVRAP
jgi:hypothetical protein